MIKIINGKTVLFTCLPLIVIIFLYPGLSLSAETEEELYPTLITVKYHEGLIIITFEPTKYKNLKYRLYRANEPIKTEARLIDAVLVGEVSENEIPFSDNPESDGKYTYAITILKNGVEHINLIPFQNIMLNPVDYSPFPQRVEKIEISPEDGKQIKLYFSPVNLEYIYNLYISHDKISEISDQKPSATLKGENHFSVSIVENTPYYFIITSTNRLGVENKDIVVGKNENSEAYLIKSVKKPAVRIVKKKTNMALIENNLQYNFYKGKYRKSLNTFLSILKKRDLTGYEKATVHFYTGQCYYYLEMNSKAIKYFILSKKVKKYSSNSEAWIDRCLEGIE